MTHGGAVVVCSPCSDLTLRKCPESLERNSPGGLKLTGTDPAILLGMNASNAAKLTEVLESTPTFAEAVKLFRNAIQAQFAGDLGDPEELTALLAHLYDAEDAAEALDALA